MKANKMPERVYLLDYNDAMVTPLEGDTVYVREDAFIEKAVQFIKDYFQFEGQPWYKNGEPTVKDKAIERFINYMKEE